jgi:hypothetical protein
MYERDCDPIVCIAGRVMAKQDILLSAKAKSLALTHISTEALK